MAYSSGHLLGLPAGGDWSAGWGSKELAPITHTDLDGDNIAGIGRKTGTSAFASSTS